MSVQGFFQGLCFLRPRAASRALGVMQRLSEAGGRCVLCFGGGGRGEMQIATAKPGCACAGVYCEGTGTSLAQLRPSAPARAVPRLQHGQLSHSPALQGLLSGF